MRLLPEASYERCTGHDGQPDDSSRLWRAYKTLEAPGSRASGFGLVVPQYPLTESRDVNRCDLKRLSEAVWHGVGRALEKAKSRAAA